MKYLGIDYGSKRVGLAVSDDDGRIAFPKEVVSNEGLGQLADKVKKVVGREKIEAVVIGHSANLKGVDNPIMKDIKGFLEYLKNEMEAEFHLEPEFYTSTQASRITGKTNKLDAQAAALILQSFLDKIND